MIYLNENDPYAAQWLRNLIEAGQLPTGDVDERDIREVSAEDLKGYKQCHFFAGIGGWVLALDLAGRRDAGSIWTGSCPCQPFSAAGKRKGFHDDRHLWPVWFNLIKKCKPAIVFGEQVAPAIAQGWLDAVFDDLEGQGYACGAAVLPACSVQAPHLRQRLWWVGDASSEGLAVGSISENGHRDIWHKGSAVAPPSTQSPWLDYDWLPCADGKSRPTKPGLFPLADGISNRVGRLRAYGNAIVPQVAAEFIMASGMM